MPDACEHLNDTWMIVIPTPDAACPMCAPCALGPPHDEDHDDTADACDLCPIFPDTGVGGGLGEGDADGDGVGDQCDVSTDPSHQIFDAFAEPNQSWFQTGIWTVANDELHVALAASQQTRQLGSGKSHFAIRTSMNIAGSLIGQARAGVMASRGGNLDSSMFDEQIQCRTSASESSTTTALELALAIPAKPIIVVTMPLPSAAHYRVMLEYDVNAAAIRCIASPDDGSGTPVELDLPEGSPSNENWATGLFAAPGVGLATFAYYELVTDN